MAFTINNLKKYDLKVRKWTLEEIDKNIKALGTVVRIMGRVDDMEALNAVSEPKTGDIYFVGQTEAAEFEEYVRTEEGKWEYIGVTAASVDGYVDTYKLYQGGEAGSPGEGTPEDPAEGTILKTIKNAADALEKSLTDYKATVDAMLFQGEPTGESHNIPGTGTKETPADGTILKRLTNLEDGTAGNITQYNLYQGGSKDEPGSGTEEAPAEGSILYKLKAKMEEDIPENEIDEMFNDNTTELTSPAD